MESKPNDLKPLLRSHLVRYAGYFFIAFGVVSWFVSSEWLADQKSVERAYGNDVSDFVLWEIHASVRGWLSILTGVGLVICGRLSELVIRR